MCSTCKMHWAPVGLFHLCQVQGGFLSWYNILWLKLPVGPYRTGTSTSIIERIFLSKYWKYSKILTCDEKGDHWKLRFEEIVINDWADREKRCAILKLLYQIYVNLNSSFRTNIWNLRTSFSIQIFKLCCWLVLYFLWMFSLLLKIYTLLYFLLPLQMVLYTWRPYKVSWLSHL